MRPRRDRRAGRRRAAAGACRVVLQVDGGDRLVSEGVQLGQSLPCRAARAAGGGLPGRRPAPRRRRIPASSPAPRRQRAPSRSSVDPGPVRTGRPFSSQRARGLREQGVEQHARQQHVGGGAARAQAVAQHGQEDLGRGALGGVFRAAMHSGRHIRRCRRGVWSKRSSSSLTLQSGAAASPSSARWSRSAPAPACPRAPGRRRAAARQQVQGAGRRGAVKSIQAAAGRIAHLQRQAQQGGFRVDADAAHQARLSW
jgi:hypothetical protein